MKILAEFNGIALIERYGCYYLRFNDEVMGELPCEVPVTEEEKADADANAEYLPALLEVKLADNERTAKYFYKVVVCQYMKHALGMDPIAVANAYIRLSRYDDVMNEFYRVLIVPECGIEKFVCIEGYTAKRLMTEYALTDAEAYVFLSELRYNKDAALEQLSQRAPKEEKEESVQPEDQGEQPEEQSEDAEPVPEAQPEKNGGDGCKDVTEKLEVLGNALFKLQKCFDEKIAEDEHKNKLFDDMHKELMGYRNGAVQKIIDTMALDIIQLIDSTKNHKRVYSEKEANEENYKKLLRIISGFAEDLEDILYRQSIESYSCDGNEVDVRRQKIIQSVATNDKALDNTVAERTADGYEREGKILRPERIKIFKYSEEAENKETD